MEELKWNEQYSVGNDMIDAQHRKLIRSLNRLIKEHNNDYKNGEGEVILTDLIHFAKSHFKEEEAFLEMHRFPKLQEHKEKHRSFSIKMGEFSLNFLQGQKGVEEKMIGYLRNWIESHLMHEDQEYKGFIRD